MTGRRSMHPQHLVKEEKEQKWPQDFLTIGAPDPAPGERAGGAGALELYLTEDRLIWLLGEKILRKDIFRLL